jgi:misacylated tRNA(Ala) deacylase
MTEKLYLKDSYLKEFDAKILSVSGGKFFVFDKTAFYPQGGGQPSDSGKIVDAEGHNHNVVFAKKFG